MRIPIPILRIAVILALAVSLCGTAIAQVQVTISLKRTLYMAYEPIICTVSISNFTGAELLLTDTPRNKWFGFQIETLDGRPVPPLEIGYRNEPMTVGVGETIRRSVNLTPMFPLNELGGYRIRAAIYVASLNRYFSSAPLSIEVTEGRKLWEQVVGVPPHSRRYTLLTFRLPTATMLYLRVTGERSGVIYCTTQLGRFLAFGAPETVIDRNNEIHILHNMAPKEFLYSHFGLDGKVRQQQAYQDWGSRPSLVRTTEGGVAVLGGTLFDPKTIPAEKLLPGLGRHPDSLPTPAPTPPPKKQENARPENLLSR